MTNSQHFSESPNDFDKTFESLARTVKYQRNPEDSDKNQLAQLILDYAQIVAQKKLQESHKIQREDFEDIIQNTVIAIMQNIQSPSKPLINHPKTYIYTSLQNTIRNFYTRDPSRRFKTFSSNADDGDISYVIRNIIDRRGPPANDGEWEVNVFTPREAQVLEELIATVDEEHPNLKLKEILTNKYLATPRIKISEHMQTLDTTENNYKRRSHDAEKYLQKLLVSMDDQELAKEINNKIDLHKKLYDPSVGR